MFGELQKMLVVQTGVSKQDLDVSRVEERILKCIIPVSLGLPCNAVACFRSERGLAVLVDIEAHHACIQGSRH